MKSFNIRVYGLLINEKKEILVSDEKIRDLEFTKFPGGGLEFGEGILDCLKREFLEELNISIEIKELFYLTDFLQISTFNPNDQLISIYYLIESKEQGNIKINAAPIFQKGNENHRWIAISELNESDFKFPIDKIVVEKIKKVA